MGNMGQIRVDGMTLEILCTQLCVFRPKSVGAVSKKYVLKNKRLMVALEKAL